MPRPEHTQKNSNLFADESKDRCAECQNPCDQISRRDSNEGSQTKEQEEQNCAPTSNTLRHTHVDNLLW